MGDKLKFKFFDGGIKVGWVTKLDYAKPTGVSYDYTKPVYTITVPNNNPNIRAKQYHYPCIPHDRILEKYDENSEKVKRWNKF